VLDADRRFFNAVRAKKPRLRHLAEHENGAP
jgi:hypothetical protein